MSGVFPKERIFHGNYQPKWQKDATSLDRVARADVDARSEPSGVSDDVVGAGDLW